MKSMHTMSVFETEGDVIVLRNGLRTAQSFEWIRVSFGDAVARKAAMAALTGRHLLVDDRERQANAPQTVILPRNHILRYVAHSDVVEELTRQDGEKRRYMVYVTFEFPATEVEGRVPIRANSAEEALQEANNDHNGYVSEALESAHEMHDYPNPYPVRYAIGDINPI